MRKIVSILLFGVMVLSLVSCSKKPMLTAIETETSIKILAGKTAQLSPAPVFENQDEIKAEALEKAVSEIAYTFTSSDEKIANVDETGKIMAIAEGEINIKVSAGEIETEVLVTVLPAAKEILFTEKDVELKLNETINLEYGLAPKKAVAEITFTSSDEKVVTVDKKGTVTALAEGKATITAKTENNLSATIEVSVVVEEIAPMPDNKPSSTSVKAGTDKNNNTGSAGQTSGTNNTPASTPNKNTPNTPAPPVPTPPAPTPPAPTPPAPAPPAPAPPAPTPQLNPQEAVNAGVAYANTLEYAYGTNQAMANHHFGNVVELHAQTGGDQASLNAITCQQVDMAYNTLMGDFDKLVANGMPPEEFGKQCIGVWYDGNAIYAGW